MSDGYCFALGDLCSSSRKKNPSAFLSTWPQRLVASLVDLVIATTGRSRDRLVPEPPKTYILRHLSQ